MADFNVFAIAVRKRFNEMAKGPLFVVAVDRDLIWENYLGSFPEGTNPIFRTHREFDCSCCKSFIRNAGGIVAIQNGALSSIWDLNGLPEPFQTVADAMSAYIKALPICAPFLSKEKSVGTALSRELTAEKGVRTWSHFSFPIPSEFVSQDPAPLVGRKREAHAMILRAARELQSSAVATTIELIQSGALYRGEQFLRSVTEFQKLQARLSVSEQEQELLAWGFIDNEAARFRNTVIGTLVQDLSEGKDLEAAVGAYEFKVAPSNYKRPTALITGRMVKDAMGTIQSLGLEAALERRHARFSDVSVNNVLFVDNKVRGKMQGGIEALLLQEAKPAAFDAKRAAEIGAADFVSDVLPKTTSLNIYLDNHLLGNFVSMTAPVHAEVEPLFKWGNNFAWSYDGNVTDSIKDRVKRAGGLVEGVALRVSLAWKNGDDLDLHCQKEGGYHIYYSHKADILDIDMNAGGIQSREPVENMRWRKMPADGIYKFYVNNYCKRESIDVGFEIEIESNLGVEHLSFAGGLATRQNQDVANIVVKDGRVQRIIVADGMTVGACSKEHWGLKTLSLVRVDSVILSPNHWDSAVGAKHWFFILEGCDNPLPTRGIYNEFLRSDLEKHRKVFEVLGDKTKCTPAPEQMSGVGFSAGRGDGVCVVASGQGFNRTYKINF